MSDPKTQSNTSDDFQNIWLSSVMQKPAIGAPPPKKKQSPVEQNLEQIKSFAFETFDKLDTNGNGFLETSELYAYMQDEKTPMKEKSYIMFLLTNQKEIAESYKESDDSKDGISRADLNLYFRFLLDKLAEN